MKKKRLSSTKKRAQPSQVSRKKTEKMPCPAHVTIYTTPTCPYCIMAKHWLTQKRIPFKEINVLEDEKARSYITTKTGSTVVPQIEIGRKIIRGFDREALEEALLHRKKSGKQ